LFFGRFIHGGQLLNGFAGPVCMAAPPLISATWFPANQRTTATSLALLSGNIGFAMAFVAGNVTIFYLFTDTHKHKNENKSMLEPLETLNSSTKLYRVDENAINNSNKC